MRAAVDGPELTDQLTDLFSELQLPCFHSNVSTITPGAPESKASNTHTHKLSDLNAIPNKSASSSSDVKISRHATPSPLKSQPQPQPQPHLQPQQYPQQLQPVSYTKEQLDALHKQSPLWSSAFICPLTKEILQDPVVLSDGRTYEREAILDFFKKSGFTSPITKQSVDSKVLLPNIDLRGVIDEHKKLLGLSENQ
jgi:hypothetical protein